MNRVKSFLTVVSLGLLAGCGGSDDADPNLQVGRISATPVENMRYKTNSREGKTTADGRFEYLPGETVSFFVGHIPFGSATAQAEVTLLDLAGTTDTGDRKVVNMSRFLQSLDDPADGVVSISYNMDVLGCTVDTEAFDFDQPTTFFAQSRTVSGFVRTVGETGEVVSASLAQRNLESALAGEPLVSTADAPTANVNANDIEVQRRALFGDYHIIGYSGRLGDRELANTVGGRTEVGVQVDDGTDYAFSQSVATGLSQLTGIERNQDINVNFVNGVPESLAQLQDVFADPPQALDEFISTEDKLGILGSRAAEPGDVFYDVATQEATFEFEEHFGARAYPYNDNLFGTGGYGFSQYSVRPTDVACLEALGLAPSQFASQGIISDAYAARTVSDQTTLATLQIMQSSCADQKSFDEFDEEFFVLFEQHEDFTLSNLAGRYVYAFFDVAMSRVAGEAGVQLRNGIELMEINTQGEQVSNGNYRELLSGAINGSAPEVFVSTESPVEVLPFTIPTDQQTGLPATDGSLNYNFRAFPTSPEISVFPAYLSRDNNILATRFIDSNGNDNGVAGMGLGFRIDPNAALVAGDLVDRRFEVWGFRARQQFEGDALNSLSFTNLDGLAFTFEQVGDDVIAQVQLGFDVKRLADFGRLEVVPADNRVVSSSPVTVSAAGEIQFQVEDNGENVIFTGFLGADGAILFVLQGVTGQADPIVDAEPNKTSFSSVTNATAAIGVALPIAKEIAREILAGDFQFNVVGENLTSRITIPECPDVPGFFDYTFSETAITFTGTDGWTTPECILSPITTETLEVSSLTPALDLPFNCVDYPVCRRADFDRLIAGRDENNDLFVQTYEYDIENNSVISIKTEENAVFTEIIDL